MFDGNTLKAVLVGMGIYLLAWWLVNDRPRPWRPKVIKGGKKVRKLLIVLGLSVSLASAGHAANAWQALSVGIGGGGIWVDEGAGPAFRDVEAGVSAAVSLTPHVSVVGAANYGVDRSYVRGSAGARLTATDVNDPNFSVGVGVSRHYVSEEGSGMDEAAAEAAVAWKPLAASRVIVTGLAAFGIDTGRRFFTAKLVVPFKLSSGGPAQ